MKNIFAIVALVFSFYVSAQVDVLQKTDSLKTEANEKLVLKKESYPISIEEEFKKYENLNLSSKQQKDLKDNLLLQKQIQQKKLDRVEKFKLNNSINIPDSHATYDSIQIKRSKKITDDYGVKIKRKYKSNSVK
ncbi:hypothetical protein [Faecalibacter rhinopitheci]|uniref:Uncharacterized protein n=1 Tax=Faecalibacter rhinopitheci TaxID=2779678 RepID=A0A8J7FQB4_9FLAO|nr:hypothetical protein [Faecalibacter rhinopitheci]MBF0597674.1 hypothetical protein [Faecalibacter rhinopitheci]MBQ0148437.1 hypothetical protein [Candidatus Onthonaster equi]